MHARDTIHIDAPVGVVDRLALPPEAWSRYFVGMSAPDEVVGDGGPGTTVTFAMSPPGSKPFRATATVAEWEHRGDGSVHWRGEYSGGMGGWETWDLRPEDGGTSVAIEMDAQPAGGALVRAAATLFVQRPLRRNVHQSLWNLKRLAESSEPVQRLRAASISPAADACEAVG